MLSTMKGKDAKRVNIGLYLFNFTVVNWGFKKISSGPDTFILILKHTGF